MLKNTLVLYVVLAATLSACAPTQSPEALKEELLDVDRAFSQASVEKGQTTAFLEYMAPEAVIYPMVGDPIRGIDEFSQIMAAPASGASEARLEWEPYFADISLSGDIGYTLGKYRATFPQADGEPQVSQGNYITVWKRQSDGTWRFVFDGGNQASPIQNSQEGK